MTTGAALWPPKPTDVETASRTREARAVVGTSRSMPSPGSVKLAVGGTVPSATESTVSAASTAPAAPSR
ncbi:hypothetical protein [Streptomyces sp. NBC_00090]|uniref:hypothetical protein n=1 Tax=Streptomyces sp. NBC_00090 TaxID=2903619 RepID=UPI0038631CBE